MTSTTSTSTVLHLCTTNDGSGNPRRLYVLLGEDSQAAAIVDEGYEGPPTWARNGTWPVRIMITPKEYRRWRKMAQELEADAKAAYVAAKEES